MKKEMCNVCQKEFDAEVLIKMGSLFDDSITYTCEQCFSEGGEHEPVGEGRSQAKMMKFNVVVNDEKPIEVVSTSKDKAFTLAQILDEFNNLVLRSIELNEEVHITVSPAEGA
ncbi:hypothetical protein [Alkalihalobacillus sp. BA299]|uniref:hypothetical protein n=1 Tax=Alkalihalobacillus sp. BA299 TaxID=2815938 RepID=UPI001ADCB6B9|nr:hypothetical protein [Alkalihalobacillus sp. BA299]